MAVASQLAGRGQDAPLQVVQPVVAFSPLRCRVLADLGPGGPIRGSPHESWQAGFLALLLASGCAAGAARSTRTVSHTGQANQVAKLTVHVPPGWRAVRFSEAKGDVRVAGIQLSNVRLPAPRLLPGFAIQVSSEVQPPRGVGLVIATDTDRRLSRGEVAVQPLPLPWPDGSHGWLLGSSPARSPVFETLWFRVGRTTYVATAVIGWKASHAAQKALGQIVRSIKPARAVAFATPSGSQRCPCLRAGTSSALAARLMRRER